MSTAHRIATRYFEERYARLFSAMSLQEAKSTLGFPPNSNPTPEEISKAYKRKAVENHPDRGGSHEKMVEINVAKDILEGKQRPDGPSRGWRPERSGPPRKTYEDYVREKQEADAKKVKKGENFATAKGNAPSGVEWKFRSELMFGKASAYTKEQDPLNSYVAVWVCYGRTSSNHVFMLVEHAVPNTYADLQLDEWAMSTETYPLTQDIDKLAPKAIKAITAKGKLSSGVSKATSKYRAMTELTEPEFSLRGGSVSLKDILIGTGLTSGAEAGRKTVIELAGKFNDAKAKAIRESGKPLYTMDGWKWHDFTLFVNGKPYPLSDKTVENLGKHGTSGGLFWMAVYGGTANYDFGRRRVITKIPRYGSKLVEMIEESLVGEPSDLTVQLLKAIEELDPGNKTAAYKLAAMGLSVVDDFISAKVAVRYFKE